MNCKRNVAVALLGCASLLSACAAPYDRDLVDRRTRTLYADPEPQTASVSGDAPPASTELQAYVAQGLARSLALRAAYEEWRAATERVVQASTLPDPRLSYGEFLEEIQTRTGPQERRFGLSQAFPWPGELDRRAGVADRRAEAAWFRVEATRLRVAAEIEVAFHEYAFLFHELRIMRELLELLRGLEPVVLSRIRAGGGQEDLLRLQIEIGRLEDDLASVERRRPAVSARLAHAMSLRGLDDVLPPPELVEPDVRPLDPATTWQRALAANPRLHELAQELAASRENEALAGYRGKPQLAVGLDTIQTGEALDSSMPGSGDDPVMLSLSLSLPIWGASYSAAEREARHLARASRSRLDDAESRLRAEVEEQAFRVEDAGRRIGLYEDSLIPRAREALDLTLTSYRSGSASVLDLIDSEQTLLEFELAFWRACRDYLQGSAVLRALVGGNPS